MLQKSKFQFFYGWSSQAQRLSKTPASVSESDPYCIGRKEQSKSEQWQISNAITRRNAIKKTRERRIRTRLKSTKARKEQYKKDQEQKRLKRTKEEQKKKKNQKMNELKVNETNKNDSTNERETGYEKVTSLSLSR